MSTPPQGYGTNPLAQVELATDPTAQADTGFVYENDVSGITELMHLNSSSQEVQITSGGALNGAGIGFGVAAARRVVITASTGLATTDAELTYNETTNILDLTGTLALSTDVQLSRSAANILSLADGDTFSARTALQLRQATANYSMVWSDPAAARILTIPDPLADDTFVFLAAAQTLASKTLTAPDINAGTADSLTSLSIRSTGAAYDLTVATDTVFTVARTLTLRPGDSARILTLSGNPTLGDWFDQSVKVAANPTFGNLTITSFAADWTNAGRTVADLGSVTTVNLNGGTVDSLTSLSIRDTSAAFDVVIGGTSSVALGANRALTIDVVNAAKTIKLGGSLLLTGALETVGDDAITLTTTGATGVTLPTTGTLATLLGAETLDAKTLTGTVSITGPAGNMAVVGSTAVAGYLYLRATSNPTPGDIIFEVEPGVEAMRITSTKELAIGSTTAVNGGVIDIVLSQNANTVYVVSNPTNGTAAGAGFVGVAGVGAGAISFNLIAYPAAYTTSGIRTAGAVVLSAGNAAITQCNIGTGAAVPTVLWTSDTERMRILAAANTLQGNAGLTIQGGAAAGDDILVSATAHATPGTVTIAATGSTAVAAFDSALITFSQILQQNDAVYFTQTDGNEKIDSAADGYLDYTATTAHRFNMATADTDVRLEFPGTTASGLLEWMEDEDYFRFGDTVLFNAGSVQTAANVDLNMSAGGRLYGGGVQPNTQTLAANTNLTLDENDSCVTVTTGAVSPNTITLPAASGNQGMIVSVYITVDGGQNANVVRAGADVIQNGSADLSNTQIALDDAGDYVLLQCVSASEWQVLINSGGTVT